MGSFLIAYNDCNLNGTTSSLSASLDTLRLYQSKNRIYLQGFACIYSHDHLMFILNSCVSFQLIQPSCEESVCYCPCINKTKWIEDQMQKYDQCHHLAWIIIHTFVQHLFIPFDLERGRKWERILKLRSQNNCEDVIPRGDSLQSWWYYQTSLIVSGCSCCWMLQMLSALVHFDQIIIYFQLQSHPFCIMIAFLSLILLSSR